MKAGAVAVESESAPIAIQRPAQKFEAIGFVIILASMGGCGVGMVGTSNPSWLIAGVLGFAVGLGVFIRGRF